ncbi:hypothetical protein [Nodularia harveyana]|nr:hypothetical protein [Nodularia harveyana]
MKQRGLGGLTSVVSPMSLPWLNPEGDSAYTFSMKQEEKAGSC